MNAAGQECKLEIVFVGPDTTLQVLEGTTYTQINPTQAQDVGDDYDGPPWVLVNEHRKTDGFHNGTHSQHHMIACTHILACAYACARAHTAVGGVSCRCQNNGQSTDKYDYCRDNSKCPVLAYALFSICLRTHNICVRTSLYE